ncbi:MAG: alpha/beta fold hydrolase [Chloroflexota bacterium]
MSNTSQKNNLHRQRAQKAATLLGDVNFITCGEGAPVLLIHGLAASLHDWDALLPTLAGHGYAGYALDLLGHGESAKPDSRAYHVDWLFEHLSAWIESLALDQPPVLIGHSLGGYLALDYARRFPENLHALVLADPFYQLAQLPAILRVSYRNPALNTTIMERIPQWAFRFIIDVTSISLGHTGGALHTLPVQIRAQTALDYKRTAPGVYNIPHTLRDLTPSLPSLNLPGLVIWGDRDQTLAPDSFHRLVEALPDARGFALPCGHVPHQSNADGFNRAVIEFLANL